MNGQDFRNAIIDAVKYLAAYEKDVCTFSKPIEIECGMNGDKRKVIPTISFTEVSEDYDCMSNVYNGTASEYEMPGKLSTTNIDITMAPVNPPVNNRDRICNTCDKEDVCMYKADLAKAAKEITQISERKNVFIDTDIRCKKWSGKIEYPLCTELYDDMIPRCILLKDRKYCTGELCREE